MSIVGQRGCVRRSLRVDVGPGRYNYAPTFSKDGSAGPDGGTLPLSSQCDWAFHSNREGGNDQAASWSVVPYPGSQPYSMCAPRPPAATITASSRLPSPLWISIHIA